MKTITAQNTFASDESRLRYLADASELGLPPGDVPVCIPTTLGNGKDFVLASLNDGSFWSFEQPLSPYRLSVVND
jgi:hypothetical protein